MRNDEHRLQVECVRWFRLAHPRLLLYAVPNGGQRNAIVAAKLKAEGVLAGVPDLFLAVPSGTAHGLYIEMKNGKKGVVSESQRTVMAALEAQGYATAVCRSFDEFHTTVDEYLNGFSLGEKLTDELKRQTDEYLHFETLV